MSVPAFDLRAPRCRAEPSLPIGDDRLRITAWLARTKLTEQVRKPCAGELLILNNL
jgi:hypothetical protein